MYHATTNYGAVSGMFWIHLHCLFGVALLIGTILITVWMLKNLSAEKLKSVAIWILAVGVAGLLITAPFVGSTFPWMAGASYRNNMMRSGSMGMQCAPDGTCPMMGGGKMMMHGMNCDMSTGMCTGMMQGGMMHGGGMGNGMMDDEGGAMMHGDDGTAVNAAE